MNAREEKAYIRGSRAAWVRILGEAARELGYKTDEGMVAALMLEREQAIAALREVCGEFGDNEWDDSLHLADVIDKHLGRHLHSKKGGAR